MSYRAQLLRAAVTYVALEAELRLEDLSVEERAEILDAVAAISLLAVWADVDAMAAAFNASELSLVDRTVVLEVVAELGEFLRKVTFADGFVVADETSLLVDKLVSDEARAEDDFDMAQTPGVGDQASVAEQLLAMVTKRLSDQVSLIDAIALKGLSSGSGAFSEGASAADLAALSLSTQRSDTVTTSDAAALLAFKDFQDSATAADVALLTWSATLEHTDTVSTSEGFAKTIGPGLDDSVQFADTVFVMSVSKAIAETATAAEAVGLALSRVFTDSSSVSDSATSQMSKRPADQVTPTDAGTVSLSEYATDFFDEDYVLSDVRSF